MPQTPQNKPFNYGEHTGEYVEIQGLRIHVTAGGEGEPLLLVHGIGQSAYTWRRNFDALSKNHFVIAVDMIGYGYSDKPDLTYTIEENSEFLLALLNILRIRETNIVAMGSGACYALDFMVHYPQRVKRAVCISPGGLTPEMPYQLRLMNGSLSRAATMMLTESAVGKFYYSCMFDQTCINDKDIMETYRTLHSRESKEVLSRSIKNFDEQDIVSRLRLLPHEVLYIWGSEDRWRPIKPYAETYLAATPHATLYQMRNCGHLPHEEKPERFNAAVVGFLENGKVDEESLSNV
jgi:pimeloyl-ACP methyl ester carboxylesterase